MMHGKHRGFSRLRPAKTEEEERAEQALKDFEAGKYGPPVKEEEKPKPKPKEEEEDESMYGRIKKRLQIERRGGLKRGQP